MRMVHIGPLMSMDDVFISWYRRLTLDNKGGKSGIQIKEQLRPVYLPARTWLHLVRSRKEARHSALNAQGIQLEARDNLKFWKHFRGDHATAYVL